MMLDEPTVVPTTSEASDRDEHSMQVVEYGLAIVALLAAVLLALR
jgi:hypothetical protein